jgi:hypothetical protein
VGSDSFHKKEGNTCGAEWAVFERNLPEIAQTAPQVFLKLNPSSWGRGHLANPKGRMSVAEMKNA